MGPQNTAVLRAMWTVEDQLKRSEKEKKKSATELKMSGKIIGKKMTRKITPSKDTNLYMQLRLLKL